MAKHRWIMRFLFSALATFAVSCGDGSDSGDKAAAKTAGYEEPAVETVEIWGTLDAEFDGDGIASTTVTNKDDFAEAVAIQTDGKIVVAGYSWGPLYKDFSLVRYLANGSLDTEFDGDGKAITSVSAANDIANDVAIQSDGKIVVVGGANIKDDATGVYLWRLAIVRYLANGSLDKTFDGDGKVVLSTHVAVAYGMAIQADGKLVVAGETGGGFIVVRYNEDGSLDTDFNGSGLVITPIPGSEGLCRGRALAIQPDGKIVVAGSAYNNGLNIGSNDDFAVVRYLSDGSPDPTFDGDGVATTAISSEKEDLVTAMILQPDGKIVVAGYTAISNSDNDIAVVRYNADGSLDTGWGDGGKVTTSMGASGYDQAHAAALQTDGKILVAGHGGPNGFLVVRYAADGSLDDSFGDEGMQTSTTLGTGSASAYWKAMAIQSDHKIVVAGYHHNYPVGKDFTVARYK